MKDVIFVSPEKPLMIAFFIIKQTQFLRDLFRELFKCFVLLKVEIIII